MPASLTAADLFKPDFANYEQRHTVTDEGGNRSYQGVSEDQWNHWTDQQKLDDYLSGEAPGNSTGGAGLNGAIGPDNPHYAQLRDALGLPQDTSQLISVAHVPNAATGGQDMLGAVFGPDSKPLSLGDDYYAFTPEMVAEARRKAQTGNKWDIVRAAALIWGSILTAGVATGALGAADAGAGAIAAGGGDESLGLAGTGSYAGTAGTTTGATTGTGLAGDESLGLAGASPAPAGTTSAAPGAFDAGGSTGFGGTTPLDTGAPVTTPTPDPALPAGTQAPAPVSTASPAQPATGIINGARNAAQPALDWYNGLSPAGRMVVNQGVSSAASAVLNGIGQHNQQVAAEAAEQRARDDVIRRGQVQAFDPGAFTAKPKLKSASLVPAVPVPGIIDAVRSQG